MRQGGRNQVKRQLPGWAVLLIITLVAGIALGTTYFLTKDPIEKQALVQVENARKAALPDADTFELLPKEEDSPMDWVYAGLKDGEITGYVAQTTVKGFGGPVEVIAGLDRQLTLTGVSVGGSNFSETAGLGAKSKDPAFSEQFVGKQVPVRVIKAGGTAADNTIDAITSATITSNAVAGGVNTIASHIKGLMGYAAAEMPSRPEDDSSVFGAYSRGFKSDVWVEAAFDDAGTITYFSVGDDQFDESPDYGGHAQDVDFMYQFIGKTAPLELNDIDALSGATLTTKAVVNALNDAYLASQGIEKEEEPIVLPEKPTDIPVYGASEEGFMGDVYVEAAFDEGGTIAYMAIGDKFFAESENYGARARQPEFIIQFIGRQMPLTFDDIDAVTGATVTSKAVVIALGKAYDKYLAAQTAVSDVPTYTGEAEGFDGPVLVKLTFDGDKIASIAIGDRRFNESADYGAKALEPEFQAQFIGKQVPLTINDIDAISGASYTSNAVVEAINKAYAKAAAAAEEPAPAPTEPPATEVPATEAPATEAPATEAPALPAETPAPQEGLYTGESFIYFTAVRAEAAFEGDTLTALNLSARGAGGAENFAPLPAQEEYRAHLIGQTLPLNPAEVRVTDDAGTDTAVALAINQAYARFHPQPGTEAAGFPVIFYTGEAIVYFTNVRAEAAFDGDTIAVLNLSEKSINEAEYSPSPLEEAFQALLTGMPLPLKAGDAALEGAAPSMSQAVVIAVNQAYDQFLAGQQ